MGVVGRREVTLVRVVVGRANMKEVRGGREVVGRGIGGREVVWAGVVVGRVSGKEVRCCREVFTLMCIKVNTRA